MQVSLNELIELLYSSFDFLVVVNGGETIRYCCDNFAREGGVPAERILGNPLSNLSALDDGERWDARVGAMRQAMSESKEGRRGSVVFASNVYQGYSYTVSCGFKQFDGEELFLFYGHKVSSAYQYTEWEMHERIKELSCIYAIAEWIETSRTVDEFFSELPSYLASGMHYPEDVAVYVEYGGQTSGDRVEGECLKTDLVAKGQVKGSIEVGYIRGNHRLLAEEQKMLEEIGRMLNVALDRKELRDTLAESQSEEDELRARLEELQAEIRTRTAELNQQKENLSTVNSYLSRVNRDWENTKLRLETMFEAIPDTVALIDRNYTVVMTNSQDFEAGQKCHRAFFGRERPCDDCRLSYIIKHKTPITVEVRHDDDYFEVYALPIYNAENEVDGIIEFYRDITREKNFEKQLQQADKLASLGQLVSGIGHEINNPNQFIKGNIKIIQQALDDMLPIMDDYYKSNPELKVARLKYPFFREHIGTLIGDMAHGSERIKSIVEGLKGFARKDEGLLIDQVDVNTIIDASVRLTQNEVHKHADVVLELASDLPVLTGNSQKIEQVLVNLIMNASQSFPDNRRGRIEISSRLENGDVTVSVKDNGTGISERTLAKIFDPFYTTRRARGGTGLGLAIVYRIVDEHGGSIRVSSKVGEGTEFRIALPVKKRAPLSKAAEKLAGMPQAARSKSGEEREKDETHTDN